MSKKVKIRQRHKIVFDGPKEDSEYIKKMEHLFNLSKTVGFLDTKGRFYGPVRLSDVLPESVTGTINLDWIQKKK